MMYACTCGHWHPLATTSRCDAGVPTADALDLLVDVATSTTAELVEVVDR
jgi:hypothetical protein